MNIKNINIIERMEHYNVQGLSIALIENGSLTMEEGYGVLEAGTKKQVNRETIFNACSISKFLTAMLAMKLTGQGMLELDEDVNNRLLSWRVPHHEFTNHKKVTLRSLLSHQSGIIDPEDSFGELTSSGGIPTIPDLLEGRTPYCLEPISVKYVPESEFQYSDAGFCIIQQLIEDSLGKPFKKIIKELIFEPLNMENSFIEQTIPHSRKENVSCGHKNGEIVNGKYPIYPYPAASGLWTTPSDLAKLTIELMNSLIGKSKIGLSSYSATEMLNARPGKAWAGLGVFLDGTGKEIEISSLGWGIGFQCMIVAYPYLEKGVVIMTNTDLGVHQLKGIIGEIYNSFNS